MQKVKILIILIISFFSTTYSVGIATGICYYGSAALLEACAALVEVSYGTPAAILSCNKAISACEHSCFYIICKN
jgi:hypothetical protein